MSPVGATQRGAYSEPPLGEVHAIPYGTSDAIEGYPADVLLADASLEHQVFDEPAHRIVRQRRHDRGVEAEAPFQPACDVVFSTTLPSAEFPCRSNAHVAGIEAKHNFAQRNHVPHALLLRLDGEFCHRAKYGVSTPHLGLVAAQKLAEDFHLLVALRQREHGKD